LDLDAPSSLSHQMSEPVLKMTTLGHGHWHFDDVEDVDSLLESA
jgi:hypothetical protein